MKMRLVVVAVVLGALTSGCGYMVCRAFNNPSEVCRRQSGDHILFLYDPWTAETGEERND